MHIPPGMWYYARDEQFWKNESMDDFLELLTRYQDKIFIVLGAHVHSGEVRAPQSFLNKDLTNITIMMTPGVAPIFNNNPGYTIIDLDSETQTIKHLYWRFFQLQEYFVLRLDNFISVNPHEAFGINLNKASTVLAYANRLKYDKNQYAEYLLTKMGFRQALAKVGSVVYPFLQNWITVYEQANFVCGMLNYEYEAYKACLMTQ
jgi:hypothetical protein